jgi:hypothetical protein
MSLPDAPWTDVTVHHVIAGYLASDRGHFSHFPQRWRSIISNPNFDDLSENHLRLRLFYIKSAVVWSEVPPDTKWYEATLTEADIDLLYVSAGHNPQWDEVGNKLVAVSRHAPEPLKAPPDTWERVILWGHSKDGPFTIMEGNHRMIGWVGANSRPPLNIKAYVGLSPSYCYWHYADPDCQLAQGLLRLGDKEIVEQNGWPVVS